MDKVDLEVPGLKMLTENELMLVEGGIGSQIARLVWRVVRDAAVYGTIKYVVRRMSTRRPSNLPRNYYCR